MRSHLTFRQVSTMVYWLIFKRYKIYTMMYWEENGMTDYFAFKRAAKTSKKEYEEIKDSQQ